LRHFAAHLLAHLDVPDYRQKLMSAHLADLFLVSIPTVYKGVFGFNTGQAGLVYMGQFVGGSLGMGAHSTTVLYALIADAGLSQSLTGTANASISATSPSVAQKRACTRPVRLSSSSSGRRGLTSCLHPVGGGIFLPVGAFIFCFTSYPQCHWMGSVIGVVILCASIISPSASASASAR
jgi:hypothetical protein